MDRVIIATSAQEMRQSSLRPAWERLFASGDYTIFQNYQWNELAAQVFSEREMPLVVMAESNSGIAIIPAAISKAKRELTLLGETLFDYRDILWTGDVNVLKSAWAALVSRITSSNLSFHMHALRAESSSVLEGPPDPWSAFDISAFTQAPCVRIQLGSATFHARLARNLRRLEGLGCEFKRYDGNSSEILKFIYESKSRQGDSLFRDPLRIQMLTAMARTQPEACEIFTLEEGSVVVAALVTFIDGRWRRFYTTYHDCNERWTKHSPGLALIHQVVQESLAAGLECDLMTGDQLYKRRLATSNVSLYRVSASAQKLNALAAAFMPATAA